MSGDADLARALACQIAPWNPEDRGLARRLLIELADEVDRLELSEAVWRDNFHAVERRRKKLLAAAEESMAGRYGTGKAVEALRDAIAEQP